MGAREKILMRIAAARGSAANADIGDAIRRHPRGPVPGFEKDLVQRFRDRVIKLACDVATVRTVNEVPAVVARYLREHHLPQRAVCWPELNALNWRGAGIDTQARAARGDDMIGMTGAFAGIAETGTLMLLSGPQTPATVSLLPDTHISALQL